MFRSFQVDLQDPRETYPKSILIKTRVSNMVGEHGKRTKGRRRAVSNLYEWDANRTGRKKVSGGHLGLQEKNVELGWNARWYFPHHHQPASLQSQILAPRILTRGCTRSPWICHQSAGPVLLQYRRVVGRRRRDWLFILRRLLGRIQEPAGRYFCAVEDGANWCSASQPETTRTESVKREERIFSLCLRLMG